MTPRRRRNSEHLQVVYNRENAKTYSCKLSLENPVQLIVRAYVGLPMFGKTQIWRRTAAASGNN